MCVCVCVCVRARMRVHTLCRASFFFSQMEIYFSWYSILETSIGCFFFGLVSLFNGISTFVGYLMPKLFSEKNSSGTI